MKKRQIDILNKIYQDKQVCVDDVIKEFSVSKRTFYYDIEEINYAISSFGQIKNLNKKLTFIGDIDAFKKFLNIGKYELSASERFEYILYKILDESFKTIQVIVDELQVSKTTIVNTIEDIRLYLKTLDLELEYNDRYLIKGDEYKVRNLYISLMEHDNNLINTLEDDAVILNEKADLQLSDYSLSALSKFILFVRKRIKNDLKIKNDNLIKVAKNFPQYKTVNEILGFDETESMYLSAYIAALSSLNLYISKNDIDKYVDELVNLFELKSAIHIQDLESFKVFLARHILSSYYRIKFGFPVLNPLLDDIRKEYAHLFNLVKKVVSSIEFENLNKMPDEEIAYITMYFGGNIRSHKSIQNKIIIVCPNGLMISKTIERQILNYIPMIDIVATIPIYDLDNFDKEYDFIISTISLEGYENTIVVHPMLTKDDIKSIMNKIATWTANINSDVYTRLFRIIDKYCIVENREKMLEDIYTLFNENFNKKKDEENLPMLKELLTRDRMLSVDSCKDWKEAIELAAKPLLEKDLITHEYVDAMQESLEKHGPYIVLADRFAMPHASAASGVKQLSMSLLHVKESVDVMGKPVNTFVVLATIDNNMHMKALSSLSELLYDENNLKTLLSGDLDSIDEMIQKTE